VVALIESFVVEAVLRRSKVETTEINARDGAGTQAVSSNESFRGSEGHFTDRSRMELSFHAAAENRETTAMTDNRGLSVSGARPLLRTVS
jgi:hypothetical protein